jgi:hypothetical protein
MSHKPAGGPHSKNVRHVDAPKVEPRTRVTSPAAARQIGGALAYPREEIEKAGRGSSPVGPTDNVKAVGVGGGRTIHPSGGQHCLAKTPHSMDVDPSRLPLNKDKP